MRNNYEAVMPKDVKRERVSFDPEVLAKSDSDLCQDQIATMLDRLYGNEEETDSRTGRLTTKQSAPADEERWWDQYPEHYDYSDMVSEWKRHAFQYVPESSLLNDGDQVVRIDGADDSGKLLFDLASCR